MVTHASAPARLSDGAFDWSTQISRVLLKTCLLYHSYNTVVVRSLFLPQFLDSSQNKEMESTPSREASLEGPLLQCATPPSQLFTPDSGYCGSDSQDTDNSHLQSPTFTCSVERPALSFQDDSMWNSRCAFYRQMYVGPLTESEIYQKLFLYKINTSNQTSW